MFWELKICFGTFRNGVFLCPAAAGELTGGHVGAVASWPSVLRKAWRDRTAGHLLLQLCQGNFAILTCPLLQSTPLRCKKISLHRDAAHSTSLGIVPERNGGRYRKMPFQMCTLLVGLWKPTFRRCCNHRGPAHWHAVSEALARKEAGFTSNCSL